MRYLKLFENYNREDIDTICKKYGIENYTINGDGSIDVDGIVYLSNRNLDKLPLKFRNVSGTFYCSYNNLSSFEGSPESIGGDFNCNDNEIRTLEGFPRNIEGYFYCESNPIYKLWELFGDKDKIELFNDFGITDGDVIILDRLNEFLDMIGEKRVTEPSDYDVVVSKKTEKFVLWGYDIIS